MQIRLVYAVAVLGSLPSVLGWGAAGHEIVATIAQIYLHPSVLPTVCGILGVEPSSPSCHLASIATWADRVRNLPGFRWSASLHYIGAKDDFPSQTCAFPGDTGWAGRPGVNVLGGIRNVTDILEKYAANNVGGADGLAEEALKFLVHFVGDMHMPLHLTGRERGGNGVKIRFDGRITNLHSLWDSRLLAQTLRTLPRNYTLPLPIPLVEQQLRGTIYDPYIRRVVWEGLVEGGTWEKDIPGWLTCPKRTTPSGLEHLQQAIGLVNSAPGEDTDDDIVCPYHWASDIHPLNCEIIWPKELDQPEILAAARTEVTQGHDCHAHDEEDTELVGHSQLDDVRPPSRQPSPYLELNTPEYAGAVAKRRIIEHLMAMGGIRLAAVLNWLFVDTDQLRFRPLWVENKL